MAEPRFNPSGITPDTPIGPVLRRLYDGVYGGEDVTNELNFLSAALGYPVDATKALVVGSLERNIIELHIGNETEFCFDKSGYMFLCRKSGGQGWKPVNENLNNLTAGELRKQVEIHGDRKPAVDDLQKQIDEQKRKIFENYKMIEDRERKINEKDIEIQILKSKLKKYKKFVRNMKEMLHSSDSDTSGSSEEDSSDFPKPEKEEKKKVHRHHKPGKGEKKEKKAHRHRRHKSKKEYSDSSSSEKK